MDPLSANGLASAIVQFVDYATKLAQGTRQIYVAGTSATDANADVELCASELENLCVRLNPTGLSSLNPDDEALCRLADRCKAISNNLSTLLRSIKAKNSDSRWHCFVSAVKTQLKKRQRDEMLEQLSQCRAQLDLQLGCLSRYVGS